MQVRDYLIRRLLLLPFIMLGVSIVVFTLTRFTGSPIGIYATPNMTPAELAVLEARYLLDQPSQCNMRRGWAVFSRATSDGRVFQWRQ